ncbi:MAG: hypothetical protein GX575_03485 [Candidatus Anammoximicrobium sp.]|nr:hypothetical protein [Candidatus Anammoximicrobium sp.]
MTWLTENPLPVLLIGSLTAIILAGGWLQTGSRWLLAAIFAAIALTIGAVLAERLIVTDREQVTQTLFDIAALVERNQVNEALEYAYPGTPAVRSQAAAELPLYRFSEVNIKSNLEVRVSPERHPPTAVAEFNVVVVLSTRDGLLAHRRIPRYLEVTFLQDDDGQWRVGAYEHFDPRRGFTVDPDDPRGEYDDR